MISVPRIHPVGTVLLVTALACIDRASQAQVFQAATLTAADWRADLHTLATELPKKHVKAFHSTTQAEFDAAVAALDRAIPASDADRIIVGLSAIVASIGDGHTRLRLPANWPRYAIIPAWFGCDVGSAGPCELRVTRVAPGNENMLGARILAVDGTPVADVHTRLTTIIPKGESEGAIWAASSSLMQLPNVLHGLGIVRDTLRTVFTLEGPGGERMDVNVASVPRQTDVQQWRGVAAAEPVSRQRGTEPLWWALLADSQTVYVGFNSYPSKGAFRTLTNDLMAFVEKSRATRLVIDLRRNGGGDYTKVREILLPPIARHSLLGARGHFYVLTGPQTFSAAMTNAIDFRKDARAILVGLPTGARPNQYQEGDEFTLPKSKLVVGYSTKYYKFQDEDTPGVIPDQRIEPTWASFREGRDPALEWILEQPIPLRAKSNSEAESRVR